MESRHRQESKDEAEDVRPQVLPQSHRIAGRTRTKSKCSTLFEIHEWQRVLRPCAFVLVPVPVLFVQGRDSWAGALFSVCFVWQINSSNSS